MVNALAPLAATPTTETIRTNEKFAANMMAAHRGSGKLVEQIILTQAWLKFASDVLERSTRHY